MFCATDKRLVIKVLVDKPWQDQNVYRGELYAVNFNGAGGELIYGYHSVETQLGTRLSKNKATIDWADIISVLPNDEEHILISSTRATTGRANKTTIHNFTVFGGELGGLITGVPTFNMNVLLIQR